MAIATSVLAECHEVRSFNFARNDRSGSWNQRFRILRTLHDVVAQDADLLDLDLADIASLQPGLRVARHGDTRRGAGDDDVARIEGHDLRELVHEGRHIED